MNGTNISLKKIIFQKKLIVHKRYLLIVKYLVKHWQNWAPLITCFLNFDLEYLTTVWNDFIIRSEQSKFREYFQIKREINTIQKFI